MMDLPDEVIHEIANALSPEDRALMSRVDRRMNRELRIPKKFPFRPRFDDMSATMLDYLMNEGLSVAQARSGIVQARRPDLMRSLILDHAQSTSPELFIQPCMLNDEQMVLELLEIGIKPDARAVQLCARHENTSLVKKLLDRDALEVTPPDFIASLISPRDNAETVSTILNFMHDTDSETRVTMRDVEVAIALKATDVFCVLVDFLPTNTDVRDRYRLASMIMTLKLDIAEDAVDIFEDLGLYNEDPKWMTADMFALAAQAPYDDPTPLLEFLFSEQCPWDHSAIMCASPAARAWLMEHKAPGYLMV